MAKLFQGTEVVGTEGVGAEISFTRERSVFCEESKCILLGAEISFHEGPKCLGERPSCLFEKGPKL